MRIYLFFFYLFLSTSIYSQSKLRIQSTFDTAHLFIQKAEFENAITFLTKATYQNKDTSENYWNLNYLIADCLVKQKKIEEAKHIYQKCIKRLSDIGYPTTFYYNYDTSHFKFYNIGLKIADIYNEEQKYDSAIYYLNWDKNYWEGRLEGMDGTLDLLEKEIRLNQRRAISYIGKMQLDSAINCLTEYMFFTKNNRSWFENDCGFLTTVKFYYSMLEKKYNKGEIEGLYLKSINNLYYKDTLVNEFGDQKFHKTLSYIDFLGKRIIFTNSLNKKLMEDKKSILKELKRSELYKMTFKPSLTKSCKFSMKDELLFDSFYL
jgi:tetratricopeptide (TPR) repeat protein